MAAQIESRIWPYIQGFMFVTSQIGAFFVMYGLGPMLSFVKFDEGFVAIGVVMLIPGALIWGQVTAKKVIIQGGNLEVAGSTSKRKDSFPEDESRLYHYLLGQFKGISFWEIQADWIHQSIFIIGIQGDDDYISRLMKSMKLKQDYVFSQQSENLKA